MDGNMHESASMDENTVPSSNGGDLHALHDLHEDGFELDGLAAVAERLRGSPAATALPANFRSGRRGSISAESYAPTDRTAALDKTIIAKSPNSKRRIENAISQNLLFKNLEAAALEDIVNAMFERVVAAGEVVIRQGDEGDNFYVVECGQYSVQVDGREVVIISSGGSFGELALLYKSPRLASVIAIEDGILWAVDGETFRRTIVDVNYRKRRLYESFLREVPILSTLRDGEIVKIADALEPVNYEPGAEIIREGDVGDAFYIVVEGECIVTKKEVAGQLAHLKRGDYFGELALLNQASRAATVCALTPVSCVCLTKAAFVRVLGPIMNILKRNTEQYQKYQNQLE